MGKLYGCNNSYDYRIFNLDFWYSFRLFFFGNQEESSICFVRGFTCNAFICHCISFNDISQNNNNIAREILMNGTEVKITFYIGDHTLEEIISLTDTCEKVEGEDAYIEKFDDVEVKFTQVEQFAQVIYQGIMTTIEQYYNHEGRDSTVLAFGSLLVPVAKVDGVRVEPIFKNEIPEENFVTVEEVDD